MRKMLLFLFVAGCAFARPQYMEAARLHDAQGFAVAMTRWFLSHYRWINQWFAQLF